MAHMYNENVRTANIDIATTGNNTLIAAPTTAGNYLAIDFISFLPTTAVTVQLKSDSTNLGGPLPLATQQAVTWENASLNQSGVLTCNANEAFIINLSSNVQLGGIIRYREVGN